MSLNTDKLNGLAKPPFAPADGSAEVWNAAIDAAIKEISRMMYAPSPRYDSLGRMTLTCAAKKIDALRKNPPNESSSATGTLDAGQTKDL